MLGRSTRAGERSPRSGIQPGRGLDQAQFARYVLETWRSTRSRLDQEQLAGPDSDTKEQLCRLRVIEGALDQDHHCAPDSSG